MRIDDLARTATESLLADTTPDTAARLTDLKRTRLHRSVTRTIAAGVSVAAVVGGWAVLGNSGDQKPEPAAPTYQNGALLVAGSTIQVADAAGERLILPDDYTGDGGIAFTADGSELLYNNSAQRIEAIDVITGETRVVVPCGNSVSCPTALSPDGRWLALPENGGIRLREVNGEGEELLGTPGVSALQLAWSPDSRALAYTSPTGLYTVSVTGAEPRLVVEPPDARPILPQWSPDGRTIAFLEARPVRAEQPGVTPEQFVLRLVDPDGGDLRDLNELGTCFCIRHPGPRFAWAPDGTAIAATRVRARGQLMVDVRSAGLHVITLDGRSVRLADAAAGTPAWRPIPEDVD